MISTTKVIGKLSKQDGITGIETAIILIAFVVVASVFAYSILSAGIFSTQKAQQAIMAGLDQAESTLHQRGGVIAYKGDTTIASTIGKIEVTVTTMSSRQKADLTPPYVLNAGTLTPSGLNHAMAIAFSNSSSQISSCAWTLSWIGQHSDDYLLESGEQAVLTVWLHDYQTSAWQAGATPPFLGNSNLETEQLFNLEIKPQSGAVMLIQRTTPPWFDNAMDLN